MGDRHRDQHEILEMKHATQKPNFYQGRPGVLETVLIALATVWLVITFPISVFCSMLTVKEYERAVLFRLGRLKQQARGPGLIIVLPFVDKVQLIDMRTVSVNVPAQEILTRDSVTMTIDAVVYYRVKHALMAVCNVANHQDSTRLLAQTTLRNILGTKNLCEILSDRDSINRLMQSTLDEVTEAWGVEVERIEIIDAQLPTQMRRAMAAEAEATREAKAKLINAEGEQKASSALRDAAQIMSSTPQAIQLRYLQTLHTIAAEHNSTIIFPLPIDLISAFMPNSANPATSPGQVVARGETSGGSVNSPGGEPPTYST